jgi:hypothetical protein
VAESEDVAESGRGGPVEETSLGALLDHLGRDADGARGDFAEGGGEHVDCRRESGGLGGGAWCLWAEQGAFDAVVDDEEGCGGGHGAEEGGGETGVHGADCAREGVAGFEEGTGVTGVEELGLEAGFYGVEGVEGEIYR